MALRYIEEGRSKISLPAEQLLGCNWSNSPATHPISTPTKESGSTSSVQLRHLCCENLSELKVELRKAKERLRHKRDVILGCIRQPGFEV